MHRRSLRDSDLLHLLQAYQTVIAGRPLEVGNREFLAALIRSSSRIGDALARAPRRSEQAVQRLRGLRVLLAQQTPDNAKELARQILHLVGKADGGERFRQVPACLYVNGPLPILAPRYDAVQILFGNGLGLGDQIACWHLVRSLRLRYAEASATIYTLYPKLWIETLPEVREVTYLDRPLRPFEDLALRRMRGRELVVVVDFDCFDLHRRLIGRRAGRDVVEVSLGRLSVWLWRHPSPWVHVENFGGTSFRSYYYFLDRVAARLLDLRPDSPWEPRAPGRHPRPANGVVNLLINPFTSKSSGLGAVEWAGFVDTVKAEIPSGTELVVHVFPGLHEISLKFAEEVRRLLGGRKPSVRTEIVQDGGRRWLSPFAALPRLIGVLGVTDLCLCVDTFTGHLGPLYGVPTVVLTARENREFWVPGPWSYYCLTDRAGEALGPLVRHLLAARDPGNTFSTRFLSAAGALDQVVLAARAGITSHVATCAIGAIRRLLEGAGDEVPYRDQAQEWLLLWSRIAVALGREEVSPNALDGYGYRWSETEFVKLCQLYARQAGRTS